MQRRTLRSVHDRTTMGWSTFPRSRHSPFGIWHRGRIRAVRFCAAYSAHLCSERLADDGSPGRCSRAAFLTTSLVRPRVFPFPLGFATKPGTELRSSAGDPAKDASAATSSLYWESGLQPHVGRFQIGAAFDAKAREAQVKATSAALKEGGPESDASRKMRGEIYTERRRMAHQRIHHLKLLCMLALLSFASRRLAGLAAVPVLYGIWSSEMERLLVGRKSEYKHPKRGKALRAGKVEGEKQPPGMGMGYLYRPGEREPALSGREIKLTELPSDPVTPRLLSASFFFLLVLP